MKKILLSAGLLCFSLLSFAQQPQPQPLDCTVPVGTVNQNFGTFTEQSFPQKCWTASDVYPSIYINNSAVAGERNVSFYSGETPNVPFYLVTPELNTIDGIHALSFDAFAPPGAPGTITVQVGTLTNATDYTTFVEVGTAITLTAASTNYNNIIIPADATKKFIAFKVIATGAHNVAKLDNIVWKGIPATCTVLETLNENFSNFTDDDLTLNCWSKSPGTPMFFISKETEGDNKYASFYTLFSANVDAHLVTPELSTIDGNHQLTFDASLDAGTSDGSAATLQVGTLTVANDYTTFVAAGALINLGANQSYTVNIPASETAKFIAFRFSGTLAHTAATLDNVVWDEIPTVCTAQETLNEDFQAIEEDDLAEGCWTVNSAGPMVSIDGTTDKYVSFYSFSFANTAAYLISPELTTIDGNHKLSFDTVKQIASAPGTTTVQVGTLSDLADMTTFIPFGTAYTVNAENTAQNNIIIPATTNHKYIAFKIEANGEHVAIELDNVVWEAVTAGIDDVTKTSFSIYPNPTANKNVTISHNLDTKGSVNIYSLTGAKVYTGELDNSGAQSLNLSSLSAGMYIVKIDAGNYSESKKLIIQ